MSKFNKLFMLLFAVIIAGTLQAQNTIPAPSNLTLTPVYSGERASVKLAWEAPAGVTGLRYSIYRKDLVSGTTGGAFVRRYANISALNFTDAAVSRGKSYAYYVVAVKNNLISPSTDTQTVALTPMQYSVILGTVTNESGSALRGAKIQVIPFINATTPVAPFTAVTDSLGNYKITVLPGKYALYTSREGYLPEYYNDKATLALADSIVVAGTDTVNASVVLSVEPAPSAPANLVATVVSGNHSAQVKLTWEITNQNPAVRYAVYRKEGGLNDTNIFKVKASGISLGAYTDMQVLRGRTYSYYVIAYKGSVVSEPSNKVEAVIGEPVYAWVYGTVTADSTGLPIARANVNVFAVASITAGGPAGQCVTARTDSLGKFAVRVTPGQYAVYYSAMGMVSEYFNNKATLALADKLTLAANDSVAADAGLAGYVAPPTYYLSGKVTDAANNVKQARITVFRLRSNTFHYTASDSRTDSLGNYKVRVKVGDTVVVFAQPVDRNFLPEYYNNKLTFAEADRIAIAGSVADVNIVLDPKPVYPNGISGVVADSAAAGVLAHVAVYKMKANGKVEKSYSVISDSLGAYSFVNLLPGKYILRVIPTNNYLPTYFRYDGAQAYSFRNADSIMVDSASLISGINVTVRPRVHSGFGKITGNVRSASREMVTGAFIFAVDANNEVASFAITDKNGNYEISDIAAGVYTLATEAFAFKAQNNQDVAVDYLTSPAQSVSFTLTPEPDGTTSVDNQTAVVDGYALLQNYPNPFNPATTINYTLAEKSQVRLIVYDMVGREVAVLVNEEQTAGSHAVTFNAAQLASGVYFYKLQTAQFTATKKLVLMK